MSAHILLLTLFASSIKTQTFNTHPSNFISLPATPTKSLCTITCATFTTGVPLVLDDIRCHSQNLKQINKEHEEYLWYFRALGLPTKLAPYRSDTVYPAMIATMLSQYEYVLICDKSNIRVSGSPQY
ncbi:hypothetical protein PHYBLDRAFT_63995 [Phycomyces blakesleeanus NRRL 1555(-)]|uniref:Uncharacterized protein n=1 Tax=Phycomyces blakesleeanus (strain ATCC 8743b / DSM 1359 / FGSC 10004 / NBRC 33097 / NRRL 1555) TaxID=763407 RepID=A0A167LR86_PHYB8|nr:hypothetical protein PHYBLDRAFT_63995 [Phycomyces blakesleeanus NRRL 1555(-)]OAD70937.1 hypothetical protein PHYBLDRAFT_63995 [Phycomyces blakesleeanus NRRL 1555(-)]|eukprot:XP_018288977.1 hypothetical protein PHYBLDRAFT_63995 [Phycomyces blakesleeanus NRRL 1555(-)]